MSGVPVHAAARLRGAAMAVWMDVDTWLRLEDPDPAPTRVQVAVAEPKQLPDRFAELLERLDQVAAAHKRSRADRRGGHYSGRRGALISDRELAREFYELCLVEGVAPSAQRLSCRASRSRTSGTPTAGRRQGGSRSRAGPGLAGWPHEALSAGSPPYMVKVRAGRTTASTLRCRAGTPTAPRPRTSQPFAC